MMKRDAGYATLWLQILTVHMAGAVLNMYVGSAKQDTVLIHKIKSGKDVIYGYMATIIPCIIMDVN